MIINYYLRRICSLLQITQLTEENQRLKACMTEIQETSMSQMNRLKDQLEQNRQHIMRLESKLESQKDYEDLKREIRYVWTVFQNFIL